MRTSREFISLSYQQQYFCAPLRTGDLVPRVQKHGFSPPLERPSLGICPEMMLLWQMGKVPNSGVLVAFELPPRPLTYHLRVRHRSRWCFLASFRRKDCTGGLLKGASAGLKIGGYLFIYGPFALNGLLIPDSNKNFNESLKGRSGGSWGIRDVTWVTSLADEQGLELKAMTLMPANNFFVVFKKVIHVIFLPCTPGGVHVSRQVTLPCNRDLLRHINHANTLDRGTHHVEGGTPRTPQFCITTPQNTPRRRNTWYRNSKGKDLPAQTKPSIASDISYQTRFDAALPAKVQNAACTVIVTDRIQQRYHSS